MKKYDVRKVVSSIMKSFNTEYATESQMESALERALTTAETDVTSNEPWETLLDYIKNSKPKVVRVKFHDEKWYYGVPSHSGMNIALFETNSVYADMKCMCPINSSFILDWERYVEDEKPKTFDHLNTNPFVLFAIHYKENWYWGVHFSADIQNITLCDMNTGRYCMRVPMKDIDNCISPVVFINTYVRMNRFEAEENKHQWMYQYSHQTGTNRWMLEEQFLTLTEIKQKHPAAVRFLQFNIRNCGGLDLVTAL